jgi:hypothetical protein
VSKALVVCLGPKSKKQVMARFLTNLKISVDTLDNVLPIRLAIAHKKVLAKVNRYLE